MECKQTIGNCTKSNKRRNQENEWDNRNSSNFIDNNSCDCDGNNKYKKFNSNGNSSGRYNWKKTNIKLKEIVKTIAEKKIKEQGTYRYSAKFKVEDEKINNLREEMLIFFEKESSKDKKHSSLLTNDLWFDLGENHIVNYYMKLIVEKKQKTVEVNAFIAKGNNQYYLYIFC